MARSTYVRKRSKDPSDVARTLSMGETKHGSCGFDDNPADCGVHMVCRRSKRIYVCIHRGAFHISIKLYCCRQDLVVLKRNHENSDENSDVKQYTGIL